MVPSRQESKYLPMTRTLHAEVCFHHHVCSIFDVDFRGFLGFLWVCGDSLAWLAGHRLHLRVTTRPYPTAEWAKKLHELTPDPLGTSGIEPWTEHLVTMQHHLRQQTMAEKEVFLGVRLASRSVSHRLISTAWRKPGNIEHARLLAHLERVTETMTLPGLDGRPATAPEMEWLLRRSLSIGMPAPTTLAPLDNGRWDTDDLHSFEDGVEYAAEPLGRSVHVTTRGSHKPVERHVAVMSIGRVEEIDAPEASQDPWLSHTDHLPFPVEWSCQFDVLSGTDARKTIQKKLLMVRDMQKHFAEHDLDEPLALDRQARQAREVEDQMTRAPTYPLPGSTGGSGLLCQRARRTSAWSECAR